MAKYTPYEIYLGRIASHMRRHFAEINKRIDLTDEDKQQLKNFYLEHLVAPKARRILKRQFPEEFKNDPPDIADPNEPSEPILDELPETRPETQVKA